MRVVGLSLLRGSCADCHLARRAIEAEGITLAVIHKEQGACLGSMLIFRAEPQFISYAIFRAQELGSFSMRNFECRLY